MWLLNDVEFAAAFLADPLRRLQIACEEFACCRLSIDALWGLDLILGRATQKRLKPHNYPRLKLSVFFKDLSVFGSIHPSFNQPPPSSATGQCWIYDLHPATTGAPVVFLSYVVDLVPCSWYVSALLCKWSLAVIADCWDSRWALQHGDINNSEPE